MILIFISFKFQQYHLFNYFIINTVDKNIYIKTILIFLRIFAILFGISDKINSYYADIDYWADKHFY